VLLANVPSAKLRPGHQAVEQAGIVLRDRMLLRRAARRAPPNRERRHAVRLDEVLLRHHHRLGVADVAAVVPCTFSEFDATA
jgi:hypothetical protein